MANSGALLLSVIWQALTTYSVLSVLPTSTEASYIQELAVCPPFSCGLLQNISYPFRRQGDPPGCGVQAYELVCSGNKAIIHINTGTYSVTNISYKDSLFWVIDADLDDSSCFIPRWNQHPYVYGLQSGDNGQETLLCPDAGSWATFVNCSRLIENNGMYKRVACLSTKSYFVYVLTRWNSYEVGYLEPSCQYLAMIPLGSRYTLVPDNASYVYVAKFMKKGFAVNFPQEVTPWTYSWIIDTCLKDSMSYFHEQMSSSSIQNRTSAVVGIDMHFLRCVNYNSYRTKLFWAALVIVSAIYIVKFIIVLAIVSRFMFAPLAVLTFLAYKYWKTKISIDAVEKFLQMQLALGPRRYAYTDIIAITSHFREKLGQGGYGSVYKGVLPGDVHVAVKMLSNSLCNGEEFIARCPPLEEFTMLM